MARPAGDSPVPDLPPVIACLGCGRQTLGNPESMCEWCAAEHDGHRDGERRAAELMFHLAIAGARASMRDDGEVRQVFEYVMRRGTPAVRVPGVSD